MTKIHPAIAEHVMEENEKLREVLRCIADLPMDRCITENDYRLSAAKAIALGALSQKAEPTDTFTATDMATAAAQGFRDGQAAVEQAAAQDEREAFEVEIPSIVATFDGLYLIPVATLTSGEHLMTVAQHLRIEKQLRAALARPAQTVQQQSAAQQILDLILDQCRYWQGRDEARRGGFACLYAQAKEIVDNAAPVANAATQPVAMVDANDDGMWADILPDVSVKVGQMLYAAPIAQPAQTELVETLEWYADSGKSGARARTALANYRAALAAQGGRDE